MSIIISEHKRSKMCLIPLAQLPLDISISSPVIRVGGGMRRVWRYDLFLSFRGPDVRRGFVDHLYNALTNEGIHAFLDAHQMKKGDDINATIKHAIECSRFRIPILSPDYATSVWCLKEVSFIARQEKGRTIPLFYKISPSRVRHPERPDSPFGRALQDHQVSGRHTEQEIREWKAALFTVSSLSGWSLDDTNGYEAALVKRVVQYLCQQCKTNC